MLRVSNLSIRRTGISRVDRTAISSQLPFFIPLPQGPSFSLPTPPKVGIRHRNATPGHDVASWRATTEHADLIDPEVPPSIEYPPRSPWPMIARLLISCLIITSIATFRAPVALAAEASSSGGGIGSLVSSAISFVLHLDVHLGELIARYGAATYAILFGIVFAETGLVVTPFLPGDSLLFATGALAALGKLKLGALLGVYVVAATLGDAVNYAVGNFFGTASLRSSLIKKEYIERTERFYEKYGGKTIILARFVPIVRTFAPFVAGVGSMSYSKFGLYNVVGALLWTGLCTGAGFIFGNVPAVHDNFSLVVLGIVAVSLLPIIFEIIVARNEGSQGKVGRIGAVSRSNGSGGSLIASFG